MGSSSQSSVGEWGSQAPSDQPPMQSSNPAINYTGSFGQPSNNFQGMGKSPQVAQTQGLGSNPMAQQAPIQQPQQPPMHPRQQQWQSPYGRLGQFGGQDGAVDPTYMAMQGRPEMQQRYNDRMKGRPNIWG